jgi:hypothetical protein
MPCCLVIIPGDPFYQRAGSPQLRLLTGPNVFATAHNITPEAAMEKENKVFWRVKAQDELGLAASATEPDDAAYHRRRAIEFQGFADQAIPPDIPLDYDVQ